MLSPEHLVMRARAIQVTLDQGMDHITAALSNPRARAPDRRRSRSVTRPDEGDVPADPRLEADRALTGEPLRQPRSAGAWNRAALDFLARVDSRR
jgi:hypothetical protein